MSSKWSCIPCSSGRVYCVVGQEYKVNTPGENKTWYILGSLEYPTGDGLYEIYEHQTNVEVRQHWQHLLDMCPDDFVFLVRDNASQHVTPDLDDFLIFLDRASEQVMSGSTTNI